LNQAISVKENVNIESVYEIKFLGVVIDAKICWKSHIKYIQTKMSKVSQSWLKLNSFWIITILVLFIGRAVFKVL